MANNPGTPEARRALNAEPWAYFACTENGASKFWRIRCAFNFLETWWGRNGTTGQSNVKTYPNTHAATEAYRELRAAKLRKGYRRLDGTPALAGEPQPFLGEERETWAAKYQGTFAAGTASWIGSVIRGACSNSAQQHVVRVLLRDLLARGGGRETVVSERGSALGELVVSREPGDGLLDAERAAENQRQSVDRNRLQISGWPTPGGLIGEVNFQPRRETAVGVTPPIATSPSGRPQVDPLTNRVAVYALRDVCNGVAIIHRRGFKQMLRSVDAAELVTGSRDYGYQHPDEIPSSLVTSAAWPDRLIDAAGMTANNGALSEEIEARARAEAAANRDFAAALNAWARDTGFAGAAEEQARRLSGMPPFKVISPDHGALRELPWLVLVRIADWIYWRIRLCGRWLEVSSGGTEPTPESGSREAREYLTERAAALYYHEQLTARFAEGFLPHVLGKGAAAHQLSDGALGGRAQKPVIQPQGTVALARFAGIEVDDEEI